MKRLLEKLGDAKAVLLRTGLAKPTKPPAPEILCGGTVGHTDPDAPKVIESGELTAFSVSFFLAERWTGDGEHRFAFEVKPEENGVLTAYENRSGIRCPADSALLQALQEVIARNNLAAMNGISETTAGLPPEYRPRRLKADYASGETLRYTADNDPYEAWAVQVCDVFADWFHSKEIVWNVERKSE